MKNEIDIIRDVAERLERAGIDFMLTGSMAMNYYAEPRMTRDIDMVLRIEHKDVDAIVRVFTPDYYLSPEAVRDSITHSSMFNLIHQHSVIKVDCIVRKNTEYRRTEFERRQRVQIGDFTTFIVSKEDLIISKLDWARDSRSERQLADIKNLTTSGFDLAYIQHWTHQLGLTCLWEEISK